MHGKHPTMVGRLGMYVTCTGRARGVSAAQNIQGTMQNAQTCTFMYVYAYVQIYKWLDGHVLYIHTYVRMYVYDTVHMAYTYVRIYILCTPIDTYCTVHIYILQV